MKKLAPGQILAPEESLADYISQSGVRPGPRKLAQFQTALRARGTPPLCAQDGKGDAAIVYVKLFDPCGSGTWYLTEWDAEREAFGYVTGLGCDEQDYMDLEELANVAGRLGIGIEIDTGFHPSPLGQFCNRNSENQCAES